MMFLKSSMIILFLALILSCTSTKSTSEMPANDTSSTTASKMIEAGYQKATVVVSKIEGDCPVTLKLENTTTFLDPINLDDVDALFRIDGVNVWVTYMGLRRMNRCDKATPINISDIQKRTE